MNNKVDNAFVNCELKYANRISINTILLLKLLCDCGNSTYKLISSTTLDKHNISNMVICKT